MIQYPLEFNVESQAQAGINAPWKTMADGRDLSCAVPTCFEGNGEGLSPEDLYAMSLLNCFLGTFKVYAQKSRLAYERITGNARLFIDRNEKGIPWMDRVHLNIELWNPENQDKAEKILNRVKESGMILNSVQSKLDIQWKIHS